MPAPTTANVTRPKAFSYGAALDGRLFRLATRFQRVQIETAPPEAPRVDTASNPEEIVEEHGRVFARSSFEGGEGLFRAHVRDAAPDRYWDSRGISIDPGRPGELPEVTLARSTEHIQASTATRVRITHNGSSLWMTDGLTAQRTDNPNGDTPTFAEDDPHAGDTATTVEDLASLGDVVFAALGTGGVHQRSTGGTWTSYSNVQAERVWVAQGRLFVSDGESLYQLTDAAPNPSALKTLETGQSWTDVTDAGVAVLVSANDGYVYAFTEDAGTLTLAGQTQFPGETPTTLAATQGQVAIGSSQGNLGRLWVGSVSEQSFTIGDRQLVREWREDGVDRHPFTIAADRTSFYTPISYNGRVDVWRYELRTSALSRHLEIPVSADAEDIAVIEGSVFVAVDENGVWRENGGYVSSGYLIGPLGDFYSASPKSWVGARLDHTDPSMGAIELYYTTDPAALADSDSTSWTRIISRTSGTSSEEVPLTDVSGRWIAGMVKLRTDRPAETMTVRAFGFRGYASAGEGDVLITLPIDVSDQVERKGRHRVRVRGLGDDTYRALRAIEGRPTLLQLYRPAETVRGLVESVGTPVETVSARGSVTHVSVVTIRGRRVSGRTSTVTTGTTGSFMYGSTRFGGTNG